MNLKNYDIAFFGDSVAKGCYINNGEIAKFKKSFVDLLDEYYDTKIENHSIFGQTLKRLASKNEIEKFIQKECKQPKCIFFCIGGNDSDYIWDEIAKSPEIKHLPKTPLSEFSNLLSNSIKKLKDSGTEVIVCTIAPIISEKYFDNVIATKFDKKSIMKFFKGDVSNIARHQEIFNVEIIKCALLNNCKLIDIRSVILDECLIMDLMCEDGVHPNELGHRKIADKIISELGRI